LDSSSRPQTSAPFGTTILPSTHRGCSIVNKADHQDPRLAVLR
jgi:hypothetical protein